MELQRGEVRFPYIVASQSRFSLGPHPSRSALREEETALVRVWLPQQGLTLSPGLQPAEPSSLARIFHPEPRPEVKVKNQWHCPLCPEAPRPARTFLLPTPVAPESRRLHFPQFCEQNGYKKSNDVS